jgi:catechol 2,3-dioxygenase-like lactoylglutathione lyase family enzyme
MEDVLHRGRLIDHVGLVASDLQASKAFYLKVMAVFGVSPASQSDTHIAFDELWIDAHGQKPHPMHIALQAPDQATVRRFYEVAMAAGGRDNGPPGGRSYHPGYYAAYVLDPDGHNVEAVHHGPVHRSAASVELRLKTTA